MVSWYSAYTGPISWHDVQNGIVLVASSTVLKPPHKMTPPRPPTTSSDSSEYFALGRLSVAHSRRNPSIIATPRISWRRRLSPRAAHAHVTATGPTAPGS